MKNFEKYLTELSVSLQYHDELNPKLWNNFKLDPVIRKKLLQFAAVWQKFANIPDECIQDIILVGGNANYNYTSFSDIDVHLFIDKSKVIPGVKADSEFLSDYLKDKKLLWTMTYPLVRIKGLPLEPYAQGLDETFPPGQGVFSLKNNKWLQKPVKEKHDWQHDKRLEHKVEEYIKMIDRVIEKKMPAEAMEAIKKKIVQGRRDGIKANGEFAFENLVFKELRNQAYLQKMTDYINTGFQKNLSLD